MLNVITFASILSNNLVNKITEKFQQSVDDKLNILSDKYKRTIHYIENSSGTIIHTDIEKYGDGTIKTSFNAYDLLDNTDKEDINNLIQLGNTYKQDSKTILKYLLPLARNTLQVNDKNEILTYDMESYVLFMSCLPDCIRQDRVFLTKGTSHLSSLSEETIYSIESYTTLVDKNRINEFKAKYHNPAVDDIITKLYALDFLVDF